MANAEQAEQANYGTFECIYCGEEFTKENPCYNDDAIYADGSHRDGECKNCVERHEANNPVWHPSLQHERGE